MHGFNFIAIFIFFFIFLEVLVCKYGRAFVRLEWIVSRALLYQQVPYRNMEKLYLIEFE